MFQMPVVQKRQVEHFSKNNEEEMKIAAVTFRLHAPWMHSLKEKRMIVKSLVAKRQNRFDVSAADILEEEREVR